MNEILFHYQKVHPATWVYLSSLLMIGLFFKFNRFWSVRNADLILLILLSPGLLLVHFGEEARQTAEAKLKNSQVAVPSLSLMQLLSAPGAAEPAEQQSASKSDQKSATEDGEEGVAETEEAPTTTVASPIDRLNENQVGYLRAASNEKLGYLWLFAVSGLLLIRLLVDPTMVRRPLLEPNLSMGGLAFIGISLFVFLMANVIYSDPTAEEIRVQAGAAQLVSEGTVPPSDTTLERHGPSYALLSTVDIKLQKAIAIGSHWFVVLGLALIGYRHFNNLQTGIGIGTLYLMLPYTALMTGRVDHVLPAALVVWAVLCYRQPLLAGMFIGLASGFVYYPLFLLPLWISFYWRRGLVRFLISVIAMLGLMVVMLAVISPDVESFTDRVREMFGVWWPRMGGLEGIWELGWNPAYRLPILALYVMLSLTLAIWPAQKNLGTLLSCSAAVMVATQFWHGYGGGLYMAWFLPLMLLTIFRPNLEDRVALVVLREGWFSAARRPVRFLGQAAMVKRPTGRPRGWWQPSALVVASRRATAAKPPGQSQNSNPRSS